jgi:hypothetical protein
LLLSHRQRDLEFYFALCVLHNLINTLLPPQVMPASRISKAVSRKRGKEYAKEIKYVEKKERRGAIGFAAVDVPSGALCSSSSRHFPLPSAQYMIPIDCADVFHDSAQAAGPSKKSRKSVKVYSSRLPISVASHQSYSDS